MFATISPLGIVWPSLVTERRRDDCISSPAAYFYQAPTHAALLLAEHFPTRIMNEVQPGAGRALNRLVTVFLVLWNVGQKMLHIEASDRAFKQNGSHSWQLMPKPNSHILS